MTNEQVNKLLADYDGNREWYKDWTGIDASLDVNIFHYGLIMRSAQPSDGNEYKFECWFLVGFKKDRTPVWWHDYYDYQYILGLLRDGDYDICEIAEMCGMTEDQYIDAITPQNLLSDLINMYGVSEITDFYGSFDELTTEDELLEIIGFKRENYGNEKI